MGGNTSGATSSPDVVEAFLAVGRLFADPLLLISPQGRIVAANDAFGKLSVDTPAARGVVLTELCLWPDALLAYLRTCSASRSPLPGACTTSIAGVTSRWRMLGALVRQAAEGRDALIMLRLIAADTASPFTELNRQVADLNREVGRRLAAEQALRERQEELQQLLEEREHWLARERDARLAAESASRLKDEFLALLSHELRTPLNAIVGWSRMLKSGSLPPERTAHALAVISKNADLQRRVVEDLLDFSRIITGRLRLDIGPIDIRSVVSHVVDSVRPAAENKGIVLTLDAASQPLVVKGDEMRLQQVVWNLLSNAVKFTEPGGRVAVSVVSAGNTARVDVADSGEGFAPEFRPALFQPFRQADASSTRAHGGLGLGLMLVRQLVEAHGGRVDAESAGPGTGARFTVLLPVHRAEERDLAP